MKRVEYILTLSCPDRIGIVYAVASFLQENRFTILDSAQFGDPATGLFCMRIHFSPENSDPGRESVATQFETVAIEFDMQWDLFDCATRPRVVIMVSRHEHCLNDLLYRHRTGALPMTIAGVISNHEVAAPLVEGQGLEFIYIPRDKDNRPAADARLKTQLQRLQPDLVVLARYMQIIPEDICNDWRGRIINIHHSFLPGFKGARPYKRAYERGVKLIGATAHYVTADLDEGPIIAQGVERVDHSMNPAQLAAVGQDIEQIVLARAVRLHLEHRIVIDGNKTVIL